MSALKNVEVKVGAAPTPTEEATKKNSETFNVTDSKGRVLVLKKPSLLAQYHLIELIGGERASNQVLVNMYNPLLYVQSIDGIDCFFPKSMRELEALVVRVDSDGMEAIANDLEKRYGTKDEQAVKEKERNAALKD